jgi:hypothetical protein
LVACDLVEIDLDQDPLPAYEALSYSWNEDIEFDLLKSNYTREPKPDERPILCNGRTRHVTMNLYHALTEFRRQGFTTPLWADQICICQTNAAEVMAQIAMMEDIYRSASRVTIWLGKLNAYRRKALDRLDHLPEYSVENYLRSAQSSSDPNDTQPVNRSGNSIGVAFDIIGDVFGDVIDKIGEAWRETAAYSIVGRNWFRRAWTLQEFFLARKFRMLMGDREVSPSSIVKGAFHILAYFNQDSNALIGANHSSSVDPTIIQALHRLVYLFDERRQFQHGKVYSAAEYLSVIRTRLATVKKDKVAAGTALMKRHASARQVYPLTTLEVFKNYSIDHLWPEVGVSALSLVGVTRPRTEGLPSWAPDLDCVLTPLPLSNCGCPVSDITLGPTEAVWRIDDRILYLTVAEWDVVEAIGETIWSWIGFVDDPYNAEQPKFTYNTYTVAAPRDTSTTAAQERFGVMFGLLDHFDMDYPATGERLVDAFWQTLIGGHNVKSGDSMLKWRHRFQVFFAHTRRKIFSELDREAGGEKNVLSFSTRKKWLIPLVAERAAFEARVREFVDMYDKCIGSVDDGDEGRPTLARSINLEDENPMTGFGDDASRVAEVGRFMKVFANVYRGRRIFRSRKGYLGIGTEAIQAGDVVAFVAGARVPYAFRPMRGTTDTYTLIGEAYVHGLSDETIKASEPEMRGVRVI